VADIRVDYWLEASKNIGEANVLDMSDPEFWALWISALVNATMASAPDSVIDEVVFQRSRVQISAQDSIRDNLNGF